MENKQHPVSSFPILYPRSSQLPQKMHHSRDVIAFVNQVVGSGEESASQYLVLFLSRTHRLKGSIRRRISVTTTPEHVALQMAKYAMQTRAIAVIVCCMRDGDACIYPDDRKSVRVFHSVMSQCSVTFLDYVIVVRDQYLSFVDCGEMPQ